MTDVEDEPRPSATVVLVRDGKTRPEILVVKRNARSAFGAVHAFPGGVLEECDEHVHAFCRGLDANAACRHLGTDRSGLAYYSAAIREVFEEVGVLLGDPGRCDDLESLRRALNSEHRKWSEAVQDFGMELGVDCLHYFAHWVTPLGEPKRFSTRFFAAAMPAGQSAAHDGAELTDCDWITATDALARYRAGELPLIYPTYVTIKELARFESAADIIGWAADRCRDGVNVLKPAIVRVDGRKEIVFPGDPLYPEGVLP